MHDRELKLPKWAQEELSSLRARLTAAEENLEQRDQSNPPIAVRDFHKTHPVPVAHDRYDAIYWSLNGPISGVDMDWQDVIEISRDTEGELYVRSLGGVLVVVPNGGNSLKIRTAAR